MFKISFVFSLRWIATLLSSLLLLLEVVFGSEITITTPQELIDFSKCVNNGTYDSGITVYLDSDLDFTPDLSSNFEPIGINSTFYFTGTFDGQGHVIRNLNISSSSLHYVGLFGYSGERAVTNI